MIGLGTKLALFEKYVSLINIKKIGDEIFGNEFENLRFFNEYFIDLDNKLIEMYQFDIRNPGFLS